MICISVSIVLIMRISKIIIEIILLMTRMWICCSYLPIGLNHSGGGGWCGPLFRKQPRPAPICQQSGRVGRPEITPSRVMSLPRYLRYFTYQLPRGRRTGMESMTAHWLKRNPLMDPPRYRPVTGRFALIRPLSAHHWPRYLTSCSPKVPVPSLP